MTDAADPLPEIVDSLDRVGMTLIASANSTGGALELVEDMRDTGDGPRPHIHAGRDEAFYVLQGSFVFTRGREEIEAGPGAFVFIPRGTRHGYRSLEDGSRVLFLVVPPGLSGFLREQGRRVAAGADPAESMAELSAIFDVHPAD